MAVPLVLMLAAPAHANSDEEANRLLVEAVHLIHRADTTYDTRESVRLLRGADQLFKKIVSSYPQSAIAVQLSTHQLIGDFDVTEFQARIRALSCERGNDVENFLSEYGVTSATGPLTEACFLYRMENLLSPVGQPISSARRDWLDVAAAYDMNGQSERARSIILPFLALLRKNTSAADAQDSYALLARALALTNAGDQAQQVTDRLGDCSGRLAAMLVELKAAQARGDDDEAKSLADQMRDYAEINRCEWQRGIVVQALMLTRRDKDAKELFDRLVARPADATQGTPPQLAVAASMVGDPASSIDLTRSAMEREPWIVPQVMQNLGYRGQYALAHDFAVELKDPARKAAALSALIAAAAQKNDAKKAEGWINELQALVAEAPQSGDQSLILASQARAEKAFYKDERWRNAFQAALNAAERTDESVRAPLAIHLAAALAFIKTGRAVMD
ncbi:MAG TPA: hypothetical protein VHB73_06435 [Alphaproteobacteria bacterium]|nr:hypothetical protein [Alphaproteobacteria bacterium]